MYCSTPSSRPRGWWTNARVKRRDILRKLKAAGLTLQEGGRHTKVYRDGVRVSTVPRHTEVKEAVARQIEKDTNVKLR